MDNSISMLHRLRQELLNELKVVQPISGQHVMAEDQVMKGCAIIRLYCALKGIASMK